MANVSKDFCDRCGREIHDKSFFVVQIKSKAYTVEWPMVVAGIRDYEYAKCFDLCHECRKKLEQWIREGKRGC